MFVLNNFAKIQDGEISIDLDLEVLGHDTTVLQRTIGSAYVECRKWWIIVYL